jgi:hypothetical protein
MMINEMTNEIIRAGYFQIWCRNGEKGFFLKFQPLKLLFNANNCCSEEHFYNKLHKYFDNFSQLCPFLFATGIY